jgi:dephospho-CoA kinase
VREAFGDDVLVPNSMEIDRKRVADIVFSDSNKLAALNAIVHPVILSKVANELERLSGTDEVVVLDAALLMDFGVADQLDALVVVTAPKEVRKERLVERGLRPDDVEARIASQRDPERLLERADIVVSNDGDEAALLAEADRAWKAILERKQR